MATTVVDRMAKLQGVQLPVQSRLAKAYRNKSFVGYNLYPYSEVTLEAGYIPTWGKASFKEHDTLRPLRGPSNQIPPDDPDYVKYETDEHDLEEGRDYREDKNAVYNLRNHCMRKTMAGIQLKQEILYSRLAQALATYDENNVKTLEGEEKWSDKENSDPLKNMKDIIGKVRAGIATNPNIAIIPYDVYNDILKEHPALLALLGSNETKQITLAHLKMFLELEDIFIGETFYTPRGSTTFTDLWTDCFIVAYVARPQNNANNTNFDAEQGEPSFGYTLRLQGHPYSFEYDMPGGKIKKVNTTDNYAIVTLSPEAGGIIKGIK